MSVCCVHSLYCIKGTWKKEGGGYCVILANEFHDAIQPSTFMNNGRCLIWQKDSAKMFSLIIFTNFDTY